MTLPDAMRRAVTVVSARSALPLLLGLLWASLSEVQAAAGARERPATHALVEAHLAALAGELDERPAAALRAIPDAGRRLLATRSYLRSASRLDERWSWSAAQIARWEGSEEQRRLHTAVARVRCAFERENPGYTLYVNPKVRSLDDQISRWNSNARVGAASRHMLAVIARAVSDPTFPPPGTHNAREQFRLALLRHQPRPVSPLAAPGLSLHGQMRAVDFEIRRGTKVVAAADLGAVDRVWRAQGWSARLQAAVEATGLPLSGPLRQPDEPWHYELEPEALRDSRWLAGTQPTFDGRCMRA